MIDELVEAVGSVFSLSRPESSEVAEIPESTGGILLEREQGIFEAMGVGVDAVIAMVEEFPNLTERVETIATTTNSILSPEVVQTAVVGQPEAVAVYAPEVTTQTLTESQVAEEEPVASGKVISLEDRRQLREQKQMEADARAKAAEINSRAVTRSRVA